MKAILEVGNPVNIVKKGWGSEVWIHNDEQYCGKILYFEKDKKFSYHYHMEKNETWYVIKGSFELRVKDPVTAEDSEFNIKEGDRVYIGRGLPHQLRALEDSVVVEVSTQHFDEDSYRIEPGDSQT